LFFETQDTNMIQHEQGNTGNFKNHRT